MLADFEGPLDVLLHLIREQKMNIFDIPIVTLTTQYMALIEAQRELNLDVAGDYILMASTLMQIKSRMLLPRVEVDEEGEPIDPREALVLQLMACEHFRQLGELLDQQPRLGRDVFARSTFPERDQLSRPQAVAELNDVLLAFRRVILRTQPEARHHVKLESVTVRMQIQRVLECLQRGEVLLREIFCRYPSHDACISTVLAVLELWRQRVIDVWHDNDQPQNTLLVLCLPQEESA